MNTNPQTFQLGVSIGLLLGMGFMFYQESRIVALQEQVTNLNTKVIEHKEMQESRNRFILRKLK